MAKTYNYPGVYVEDVSPLSRPIAGVSTSTAGFIGISADIAGTGTAPAAGKDHMPENPTGTPHPFYEQQQAKTPKLVTSWNEFQQFFGSVCTATNYWLSRSTASSRMEEAVAMWLESTPTLKATLNSVSTSSPRSMRSRSWLRPGSTPAPGRCSFGQK